MEKGLEKRKEKQVWREGRGGRFGGRDSIKGLEEKKEKRFGGKGGGKV